MCLPIHVGTLRKMISYQEKKKGKNVLHRKMKPKSARLLYGISRITYLSFDQTRSDDYSDRLFSGSRIQANKRFFFFPPQKL